MSMKDWYATNPTATGEWQHLVLIEQTQVARKIFVSAFMRRQTTATSGNSPTVSLYPKSGVQRVQVFLSPAATGSRASLASFNLASGTGGQNLWEVINPPNFDTNWKHTIFYIDDLNPADAWLRINNTAFTIEVDDPSGSSTTVNRGVILLNSGSLAEVNSLLAHIYIYEEEIILANPGINWASPTLIDSFVDTVTGTPLDNGIDGSDALGLKPTYYLNAAINLGYNSFGGGNTLVSQTSSISSDAASRQPTISAEDPEGISWLTSQRKRGKPS